MENTVTEEANATEQSSKNKAERPAGRRLPEINEATKSHAARIIETTLTNQEDPEKYMAGLGQEECDEKESPGTVGSVAYISETLIMQITKEQKLDMIKSLTIRLPKDKLNKKIKYIENLEKLKKLQSLNLSNNMIEKMQKMETLVELRELNLANNCLKVIECVDHMTTLQVLNLSGNQITSIPGPTIKKLRSLKVLKLSHNKLETLLDVTKMRSLQDLSNVDLQGNPFTNLPHYRLFVIFQLRSLEVLDNQAVTKEERHRADQRFAQEEVQRLEGEISRQEKLYQNLQGDNSEAKKMVEKLTTAQNSMKAKLSKQADKIEELEREIEAKNGLLKAKNSDLIKASENQYRLEQELAFYKLDAKFEMLGQMPAVDDVQMEEQHNLEDSTYIGKATFKANKFTRESNFAGPEQTALVQSLRRKYEEEKRMRESLDRELQDKREAIIQLQEHLEQLARDINMKNNELRRASEKLASFEMTMATQMASLGEGNDLARKQLAEKLEFIRGLQAAAEKLEKRMEIVANNVEEKEKELEELATQTGQHGTGDNSDVREALTSKQSELQDAYAKLSQMKEDLQMLRDRIADEEAQVEMLRRQLGKDGATSEEAVGELKKELEGVIDGLNGRLEELQNQAREQQAMIHDLEKERNHLRGKLVKGKAVEQDVDALQKKLIDAVTALEDEQRKSNEFEAREKDLQDQLFALDKNNKLGQMEAQSKLKHAQRANEKLQDAVKKLEGQIENERKAARDRIQRDQERIAKALQAARGLGDKEKEVKGLALQVGALKATNEALNDRLEEAENELRRREEDSVNKDLVLERLNNLMNDLETGKKEVKEPLDETDGLGQCLADLHKKYLEMIDELEDEKQKGKQKQKQAKAVIDSLNAELAQVRSQLNAAESALAQLSQEGADHDADMKNLEEDVYRLQDNLRTALDKAGDEVDRRVKDKNAYETRMKDLEDEIERLQKKLRDKRDKDNELNHMRALAGKQKKRLENEIQELQDELQEFKDKHWKELNMKDKEIAELESLLSENATVLMDHRNKARDDLRRELDGLERQVADKTRAAQHAVNQEHEMKRAQRELDDTRKRIENGLRNVRNKVRDLEKLLNSKERRGFDQDNALAALTREIDNLKMALKNLEHGVISVARHAEEKEPDGIREPETYHHTYTYDTPVNPGLQPSLRHHHYDNSAPVARQTKEYTVLQAPNQEVSPATVADQVHHHHHYGNGDFTLALKKKKPKKKDYCNISEHEELEDDVMSLEEKLAATNSRLSSQITENKLHVLRSDLKDLEHTVRYSTVSQSSRRKISAASLESHLDETLAKFQDHLLTLMDHRTNLLSPKT